MHRRRRTPPPPLMEVFGSARPSLASLSLGFSLSLSVSLSRHFSFLSISAALSNFSSTTETLRHPWPEQELSSSHPLILMAPNLTGLMMAPL
uniref:Uncharacterized protein n=1 Tax=Fagus sylvatica TaxID=28930 RepID=A0A2N9J0N6_FAGSY